jgi:hypothetical protein
MQMQRMRTMIEKTFNKRRSLHRRRISSTNNADMNDLESERVKVPLIERYIQTSQSGTS